MFGAFVVWFWSEQLFGSPCSRPQCEGCDEARAELDKIIRQALKEMGR